MESAAVGELIPQHRRPGSNDPLAAARRLLAEAMLDNAALKDLLERSGDARGEAGSCRSSDGYPRDERTAGV